MSFTLPRGGDPSLLPRILNSNLTIRPRLSLTGSGLSVKSSPFSSRAVLSRLRTPGSTTMGNLGVARRTGCVGSVFDMYRQCMQGVRLSSTLDEAGSEKEGEKQDHGKDKAMKAEEAKEEVDEEMDEEFEEDTEEGEQDWKKNVPIETEENYKARFPAIHDITVKRKTGPQGKGEAVEEKFFKTYVTLQGRKQGWRKPRVWVSFDGDMLPEEVASMEWPTGKEGATKATILDWDETQHDLKFRWPLGKFMEFQVTEKTLVKGDRKIWREVIQKGEGGLTDGDKGEGE